MINKLIEQEQFYIKLGAKLIALREKIFDESMPIETDNFLLESVEILISKIHKCVTIIEKQIKELEKQ